ncbi:SdpI family protein [Flavobacterium sp. IMCC34852]|uniref:SdpI family protein n=1 Tax=Flavobacterium rivulicola TaxID=2732161 RepID=A0A7Y3R745_9FLAO|nr:SdpI family protein [Flavobacterium sp. IMCC34852]NNT71066.1 SdpI family protein [Flavobacterium sp. IMCC34852]
MEAILNYLLERTLSIPFLTGVIFVVMALITLGFPPKKINYLYGYRTRASMKNQQVWDFSQRYSSLKMLQIGLVLVAASFVNVFLNLSDGLQVSLGSSLLIIACAYLFFTTERAIRKNFPNN